jgi:small conductance mechanosensitive channel
MNTKQPPTLFRQAEHAFGRVSLRRRPTLSARLAFPVVLLLLAGAVVAGALHAQQVPGSTSAPAATNAADNQPPQVAQEVLVKATAQDQDIAARLQRILEASRWFQDPQVHVEQGIVFLSGRTGKKENKTWAGQLAGKTEDVVAVVNQIEVVPPSIWDLSPAWLQLQTLAYESIQIAPLLLLGLVLMVAAWYVARLAALLTGHVLQRRMDNHMLRSLATHLVMVFVIVLGLYVVLRVAGLTRLAATVLGGTGLIGLIVGIAFRDIAENFLASLLISIQRPFRAGDTIAVEGNVGIVQSVTTRGTLIMTFEGNYVHIPNSIIYKSMVTNLTANPNIRTDFVVAIDYQDDLAAAQRAVMSILEAHPAVLADPEPLVLVEELGTAAVKLRIYLWLNGREYSLLKVRSAIIRQVKQALMSAGLALPEQTREVVFPQGVPIHMLGRSRPAVNGQTPSDEPPAESPPPSRDAPKQKTSTDAEGGLASETSSIQSQARRARLPEAGQDLLEKNGRR